MLRLQSKTFSRGINSNLSQGGWGVSFLRGRTLPRSRSQKTRDDTTRWYVARAMTSQSGESEIRLSYLARASTRGVRRPVRHVSSRGSKSKAASWHAPATNVRPKDRQRVSPNLSARNFSSSVGGTVVRIAPIAPVCLLRPSEFTRILFVSETENPKYFEV